MANMSLVDKGKVIKNGNSRAIRLSANFARLYGPIEVGDDWELKEENGRLILTFPKPAKIEDETEKDIFQ